MTDIKSMTVDELKELVTALGDKPFRAKQIYSWLHEHLVTSWDEMTNLSRGLREKLKEYPVTALEVVDVQTSRLDGTQKYLQTWKFRMYFFTGGMPHGMSFLRFYDRRTYQMSASLRNAGPDLSYSDSDR